ncbi:MAG: ABC-type lipopolysaccharide export system permease component LptG [Rhodobacteraceae bacterium HLUCCO18]|nr:MAG: ABC-type lipopolysaccharide export system permease component LptG [Rhodobacteraceae bacterium HLUCCO18]
MILHMYIARRFLRSLGIVIAVFVGILLPIDIAEQMRRIGGDQGLGAVVELSLLNLPLALYQWLPLFVMLATLVLFLGLARTSELVVVRGAGRSAIRSVASPVLVAFGIGVLALLILNPIVAATAREYQMTVARYQGAEQRTVSVSAEGLWLRQGTLSEQTVIHAEGTNSDGTHLFDANFFTFDADGLLTERISAGEALLVGGAWELRDVKLWPFVGVDNAEVASVRHDQLVLPSTLTAEQIRDSFGRPYTVPIYELPGFIAQLNAAGFAAVQHRIWLQMQISNPLMLSAMVLIGAGFTMRHTRFGRTGIMVLAAILLGFGVYFIRDFAEVLGESGQLPAALVAWAPPVAAILLAMGVLLHTEDG